MTTDIKRYDFKPGLPQEFELVDLVEVFQGFKEGLTTPHRTVFYHVFWFQQGHPTHLVDFNPIAIEPDTILFLKKDKVQIYDKRGGFSGKVILFTDTFFCTTAENTKFLKSSMLFNDLLEIATLQGAEAIAPFVDLIQQMETELAVTKDDYQSDVLRNLLHNFLFLAEREIRKQGFFEIAKGPDLGLVLQFRKALDDQFKTQKSVSNYAGQLYVTVKRLNKATSKILGKSPKQMIDERVMLEAKRLLAHTSDSVKEIGFALGFEEPTYFNKYFRKHCETTPVAFRNQFS